MTIVQKFNREIKGEKLLYLNKDEYTSYEANLVFDAVANRMDRNLYYTVLISNYFPVLKTKILPQIDSSKKPIRFDNVVWNIVNLECRHPEDVKEEDGFGQYCAKENYGFGDCENYCKAITKHVIDAHKIEQVLSSSTAMNSYQVDRNFLITANLMFARYPQFYNDEYVKKLHYMIENRKENFDSEIEQANYTAAKKATLKQIKRYYKKAKKEKKMQKQKKR